MARTSGELHFDRDIRLVIRERLVYNRLPMRIDWYGYEVWQGENKLYWYDSQPHPDALLLASTHPHHKHIHPNIKHHRIPAPEMSFTKPNLTVLIKETQNWFISWIRKIDLRSCFRSCHEGSKTQRNHKRHQKS
ncbi:MAG: hypothetical protein HUU32_07265 [Calditrichaceae bacterium]|nr:hypothetical protein [Calditrichaceae bacterium]